MAISSTCKSMPRIIPRLNNETDLDYLFRKLALLHQGCLDLEKIAPDYDYSEKVQGNGFHSFISLCAILRQKVMKSLPFEKPVIHEYSIAASTLLKVLHVLKDMRCKGPDFDYSIITEDDVRIMDYVNAFNTSDIIPFYDRSSIGPFWLKDYSQKEQLDRQQFTELLLSNSWWDRVRLMFSPKYTATCVARTSITSSVQRIKDMVSMFTRFPLNLLLGFASSGNGVNKKDVWVQRLNPFVIDVPNSKSLSVIRKSSTPRNGLIRCMYMTPDPEKVSPSAPPHDGKSLILHVHGGAFMVGSPEMFVKILSKPCLDLNVPVLSVDFGLAPDNKFPAGIQDLLDVYMWLVSGSQAVEHTLGFRPTKIVLMGESSGGNMVLELAIALKMVQELGQNLSPKFELLMPKGLSVQYPCVVAAPIASPSGVFLAFDPCLSTGMAAVTVSAYPDLDPPAPDDWHRDPRKARKVMNSLKHRLHDPLFNVLAGDYIQRLQDMPLSLMLCEFDPLLDQGIAIAKRWPCKPRLMVAKGMPHGLTMSHIEKAIPEFDWITDGIRDMFDH